MVNFPVVEEWNFKDRSRAAALECKDISLTQQHMKDECDINNIVRKFGVTGLLPQAVRLPTFGDFTGVGDYQSALNAVMAAEKSFEAIPADLRKRFDNDPQKFVEFCSNPDNIDELRDLGLAPKLPRQPSGIDVVDPAKGGAEAGAAGAV